MELKRNDDFKDKVIVITGGGGVICSAIAEGFCASGAKVALLNLSLEAAEAKAKDLNDKGYIAKAYQCNVLKKDELEAVREQILADLGPCDVLINGAGGNNAKANTDNEFFLEKDLGNMKTFFDLDESGIEFVFNLNYMGTVLPSQVFARDMIGRSGCSIINISSMNAFTPLTKIPAYSGAKAAVSNFTEWLAVHFSQVGIRVNAIAPGFLVTAQNKDLLFDKDGNPSERANKILRNTPMSRFGSPEEMIGPTLFLADPNKASFVNGVVLPIDGAFNAYSGV